MLIRRRRGPGGTAGEVGIQLGCRLAPLYNDRWAFHLKELFAGLTVDKFTDETLRAVKSAPRKGRVHVEVTTSVVSTRQRREVATLTVVW